MLAEPRILEFLRFSRNSVTQTPPINALDEPVKKSSGAILEKVMAINWEPSEFDKTFVVSGTLLVTSSSGHRTLGYPQPVSVSADNQRDAAAKVRAMLLVKEGLTASDIIEDKLEVSA